MSDTSNELERAVGQLRDIRAVMAQHGRSVATLSWTLLDALLSGIAEQSRRIAESQGKSDAYDAIGFHLENTPGKSPSEKVGFLIEELHGLRQRIAELEAALDADRPLLEWVEKATGVLDALRQYCEEGRRISPIDNNRPGRLAADIDALLASSPVVTSIEGDRHA
jgi:hypothetical protein